MRRFATPLLRSTLMHLALVGGIAAGIGSKADWLRKRLALGLAHPTGTVVLQWSGSPGAARASSPETAGAPKATGAPRASDAAGSRGDMSRPEGQIVVPDGAPDYPPLSRRDGEEGTVTLAFLLQPNGTAEDVSVVRSSGHARLDDSALRFLKSTRLSAPKGIPPERRFTLSFVFKLQN